MQSKLQHFIDRFFPKPNTYFEEQQFLFERLHVESGGNCVLEHTAFEAELARIALTPTKSLSLDAMIADVIKMKREEVTMH